MRLDRDNRVPCGFRSTLTITAIPAYFLAFRSDRAFPRESLAAEAVVAKADGHGQIGRVRSKPPAFELRRYAALTTGEVRLSVDCKNPIQGLTFPTCPERIPPARTALSYFGAWESLVAPLARFFYIKRFRVNDLAQSLSRKAERTSTRCGWARPPHSCSVPRLSQWGSAS